MSNNFPKLHNAMWPGLVGKEDGTDHPPISLERMLESLAKRAEFGRWLTVRAASDYSGLSEKSVRRMLASAKLTAHRPVRGKILICRRELDALIQTSTNQVRRSRGQVRRVKR